MIVTVTLNPALDVTYTVNRVRVGASHRVQSVTTRAGGKGVNVASVLQAIGYPVLATGVVGGQGGARIREDLDARGVPHDFATCAGESRSTVNVVDSSGGEATIFNEPGPHLSGGAWQDILAHLDRLLDRSDATVLVASGSLPPGLDVTAYRDVVVLGHEHGAWTVLDAEGAALLAALESGPDLVKPNQDELERVTGTADVPTGARHLLSRGAGTVVVSLGRDGAELVADATCLRARPPEPLAGNPTGAGDAMVAALAAGHLDGLDPVASLRRAVGWSAAAVLSPVAGDVDPTVAAALAEGTLVEEETP